MGQASIRETMIVAEKVYREWHRSLEPPKPGCLIGPYLPLPPMESYLLPRKPYRQMLSEARNRRQSRNPSLKAISSH
jgi:hypothetical protein